MDKINHHIRKATFLFLLLFASVSMGCFSNFLNSFQTTDAIQEGEDHIYLKTGAHLDTYKTYKRFVGINFLPDTGESAILPSSTSAIVLKFSNNISEGITGLTYRLNNQMMSGTSSVPTHSYTYQDSTYQGTINHGAYAVGFYSSSLQNEAGYNYVVIPTNNFSNIVAGSSFGITSFTIAIRLDGVATSNISYSSIDAQLFGIYFVDTFTPTESMNLPSLQKFYTPRENSFSDFDSSASTPITSNCMTASFEESVAFDVVTPTGGNILLNKTTSAIGEEVVISTKPDAGYTLESLIVNDEVVQTNKYGQFLVESAPSSLKVRAVFSESDSYMFEEGSYASIYNNIKGTAAAVCDSVNVMTMVDVGGITDYKYIGLTTSTIGAGFNNTDFLAVQLQNLDASWRTFFITVNGIKPSGIYYMVDRLGHIYTKSGNVDQGAITEKYTRFSNATFDIGTAATEGFVGTIVIPLSNYSGLESIENISVYSGIKETSRARFNVGSMYLLDSFNENFAHDLDETQNIWKPSSDNFTQYIDGTDNFTQQYAELRYLEANEYAIYKLDDSIPYNYDVYYVTLPQNAIGADGYTDLQALGIKGILMDVVNNNPEQIKFSIRVAGSENVNLTDTSKSLWQTSIAGGYSNKVIYDTGLVRERAPGFLPYDESGQFSGKVYIPLSALAFTRIGGEGSFPDKIQPIVRFIFDKPDSLYQVKLSNIQLVKDESAYETNTIVLSAIGGTINAKIGDVQVGATTNNKVLDGNEVVVEVTPNTGYSVHSLSCSYGESEEVLTPDGDGKYRVTVNQDVVLSLYCTENEYFVFYNLDGGTNHPNNPSSYYLSDQTMTLRDPSKEGYSFSHWENEEGEEVDEIDPSLMRDITLTAVWKEKMNLPALIIIVSSVGGSMGLFAVIATIWVKRRKKV